MMFPDDDIEYNCIYGKYRYNIYFCPDCGYLWITNVEFDDHNHICVNGCGVKWFSHRKLIRIEENDSQIKEALHGKYFYSNNREERTEAALLLRYYIKDKYKLAENPKFSQAKFDRMIDSIKDPTPPPPRHVPKCPTCGSANIKKISAAGRAVSTATLGLASSKIGKQFHCNDCGYNW